jgi:hypothetical protein
MILGFVGIGAMTYRRGKNDAIARTSLGSEPENPQSLRTSNQADEVFRNR